MLLIVAAEVYRNNTSLLPFEFIPVLLAGLHYLVVVLPLAARALRDTQDELREWAAFILVVVALLSPVVCYLLADQLTL